MAKYLRCGLQHKMWYLTLLSYLNEVIIIVKVLHKHLSGPKHIQLAQSSHGKVDRISNITQSTKSNNSYEIHKTPKTTFATYDNRGQIFTSKQATSKACFVYTRKWIMRKECLLADVKKMAVELLLKAAGYLEFCIRHVLTHLPQDIKYAKVS